MADPVQMYRADVFTVGASLAGLPAISVPGGFSGRGLPIGVQFVGRAFEESLMLRVADTFERDTRHFMREPSGARGHGSGT
jgi:aspartyl-tRNA(Asn)/glutamyl-tRNA(Gln) amidotransferase subunit A